MPHPELDQDVVAPARPPLRMLTVREVATIRAALRLWIETPPEFIGEGCYIEVDNAAIADALEIESLLGELALTDQVILRVLRP